MSYILDALRKADHERERERGTVPGINAPPAPPVVSEPDTDRKPQPLIWAVLGLSVIVLALLVWLMLGRDSASGGGDPDRMAAQTPVPQPGQVPQAGSMPPPASRGAYPPVGAVPPPTQVPPAFAPQAAPTPALPVPPAQRVEPPVAQRVDVAPAPAVTAAPLQSPTVQQTQQTVPPKSTQAGAAAEHVMSMDELPEDIRRQLPTFAINGSKYSDTPASRMLIVNGQVFREGDRLAPDLTLEQIKIKEAVLRFRGYRYAMTF